MTNPIIPSDGAESQNETTGSSKDAVVAQTGKDTIETMQTNPYPGHKGYSALYEEYGKDERYKEFFSKLTIEGNDIILDHKKFALLTVEHKVGLSVKDIFSGDYMDKYRERGISGLTYMTGKAAMEQSGKQKKKLFKTWEEVDAFIDQFPWDNIKDKIAAFVDLFDLPMCGVYYTDSTRWAWVGDIGAVTLSEVNEDGNVRQVEWSDNMQMSVGWNNQDCAEPILVFEDC